MTQHPPPAQNPIPPQRSGAGRLGWLVGGLFCLASALFCLMLVLWVASDTGSSGRLSGGLTMGGMALALAALGWWCIRKARTP